MRASPQRKIVTPEAIAQALRELRAAGRTIVQCHGCFDIVHPGHIRYLHFARQLGDVLIVSLTADGGVGKGLDRPYIPQELRAENLAALEFVDWVVIDPHPTACELLALLQPDVYVKGREYAGSADPRFLREREVVERGGGRVVFHSGDVVFSSTRLLESMAQDEQLDEHRLRSLCRRAGVDQHACHETIAAFAGVPVVVAGDLLRERYVFCDTTAAAGDAPVLALQQLGSTDYWGGAAAVALQLAALGARPTLVAAVGADDASLCVGEALAERGVRSELFPVRPALIDRCTYLADDTKLFKVSDGLSTPLDSSAERRVAAALARLADGARLMIWCDFGYGFVTPGLLAAVRDAAGRPAVVAGCAHGPRSDLRALRHADLLCVTERQLRETMHDMTSSLPAVAANLLNHVRGRGLLVSLRKRGLLTFNRHAPPLGGDVPRTDAAENGAHAGEPPTCDPERLKSEFVPTLARHYADLLGSEQTILATAALTLAVRGAPADGSASSESPSAAAAPAIQPAAHTSAAPRDRDPSTTRALSLAAYLAASAEALAVGRMGGAPVRASELEKWLAHRAELRPDPRFLPDAATIADLAGLAPPVAASVCADDRVRVGL
ncbi:MAG: adenylyltransferase/cytidyltransferase family protein [Phycisphaerae bacterium]